jgi:bifunctional polynucleotide phosphatase/kinase
MIVNKNNDYIEIYNSEFILNEKIASFDLDDTLIKPKSGKKFAIDENDWTYKYENVKNVLNNYNNRNYCIIIISNQKNLKDKKLEQWIIKIKNIIKDLNIPIKVYASILDNIYRKPNVGFFDLINLKKYNKKTFYCGDAIGRETDHSDTDLKFALNLNINFYTPEYIFEKNDIIIPKIKNYFNFNNYIEIEKNINTNNDYKTLILLVGYPGSGKSTFTREYFNNYIKINLDTLKSQNKCLKICELEMNNNKNIIIDNTNYELSTRKKYIDLGKKYKYKIKCYIMTTTEEHSKHNNMYRYLYKNEKKVPEIVYKIYNKNFTYPNKDEGIDEIININLDLLDININKNYYYYLY